MDHIRAKLDYPGVSCESCRDMQNVDGVIPDCETEGKACLIPPLCAEGARIMELYNTLRALSGLVDPGTVLSMYEAQKEDIEILVIIETELKKSQKPKTH